MKILYVTEFNLKRGTGKDRATNQKLQALEKKVDQLKIVSINYDNVILKMIFYFISELKVMGLLFLFRPDFFISRGFSCPVSFHVANFVGIPTVREIHSDTKSESDLINHSFIKRRILSLTSVFSARMDKLADIRIFNHPDLLDWYSEKIRKAEFDFFSYNGASEEDKSLLTRMEARRQFNLSEKSRLLVFIGSAAKWHGVDYLVRLQEEFNRYNDDIQIIIGGANITSVDQFGLCRNVSPLNAKECADLIRAADFCLLPVKPIRVSPGSPLKLYDYIINERYVLTQSETKGYSDEVERFGVGLPVDFSDTRVARLQVHQAFARQNEFVDEYPKCKITWSDRVGFWIEHLKRFRESVGRNKRS